MGKTREKLMRLKIISEELKRSNLSIEQAEDLINESKNITLKLTKEIEELRRDIIQ